MKKTAYTLRNKETEDILLYASYEASGKLNAYFGQEGALLDTTSYDMQNYLNNITNIDRVNSIFIKNDTYSVPLTDEKKKQTYISNLELVKVEWEIICLN